MKTRDAWDISQIITDGLNFTGNGGWESLSLDSQSTRWSTDLLGRIAVLVGTETIEYVSGYVEQDGAVTGDIVVFTRDLLIEATFKADRHPGTYDFVLDARVTAVRRSTIASISVQSVALIGDDAETEWPKRLKVTLALEGGKSLSLPLTKYPASQSDSRTAAFVSRLLTDNRE